MSHEANASSAAATLQIERAGPVARVWLNRPDVRNAFNDGVIAELRAAFETLSADTTLRAIVLGARGKAFCAGADLGGIAVGTGKGGAADDQGAAEAQAEMQVEEVVEVFGDAGRHARTAVGVNELPAGFAVEVELVAEV